MLRWWKAHPRRILTTICLVYTIAIVLLYRFSYLYRYAEVRTQDWLMTNEWAHRGEANPEIVFLGVDQPSRDLDTLFDDELQSSPTLQLMKKAYPYNREVYAHAIDRLAAAGAKTIVLDLRFPFPREGDEALKAALDRERHRVVVGSNLRDDKLATVHEAPTPTLTPEGAADDRLGFVSVNPDEDQIVRGIHYRTSLTANRGWKAAAATALSLSARTLEKAGYADKIPPELSPHRIRFTDQILPRSFYEIFVDSFWKGETYKDGAFFKDKIVVIGESGNHAEDRIVIPFGTILGPLIHLSGINAALNGDFLHALPAWGNFLTIFAAGAIAWMVCAWVKKPVVRLLVIGIGAVGSYITLQILFNEFGLLPLLLSPLLAFTTSGFTWSAVEQVIDQRERARVRRTFERYVSKDVVKEILDNPQSFLNSLEGERRPVTVLFSDVRGFTTASESADAGTFLKQLNEYFGAMVRIIRVEKRGTLDKFIGDAVMAHWGSMVRGGEEADACSAVSAALAMQQELQRLNGNWEKQGKKPFKVGIGINHGEVIVGNIGSEERMEVSVIGDAVNLASRLEGVTKIYGVDLCFGESVADLVKDQFIVRSLEQILVKGKTKPVGVFTVLGPRTPDHPEPEWLSAHEQAVQLYRKGDFGDAVQCWREVLKQAPDDAVARMFIARCEELQLNPPLEPWTGVFRMKDK